MVALIPKSFAAVETAIFDMFPPTATIPNLRNDDPNRNYYASLQAGEDAMGVPAALQPGGVYPGTFRQLTDSSGNRARYVIERMCTAARIGLDANGIACEMIPPKQSLGQTSNEQYGIPFPRIPYYRLTIRVDGPNNSVTYSQAMLR